jgi:Arc/MetJ family transcription regulator
VIRHTTINLDMKLVDAARRALKTTEVTETVHRALEEVVSAKKRARLAQSDLSLTPRELRSIRQARVQRLTGKRAAAR